MTGPALHVDTSPSALEAGRPSPTLREYLAVLARRKLLVLLVLLLVPTLAVGLTVSQRPLYEGSAEVLLRHLNLAAGLTGIPDSMALQPERVAETQAKLARVPTVAERTLRAAKLRDRTVDDFLEASNVATQTNSDLLEFTVRDPDRELAGQLASAYAREYTVYRRELDTAAIQRARLDLEQRIEALRKSGGGRGSLYASLVASDEKLRTAEALLTSNASVVRADRTPVQVRPQPKRTAALAIGLALVLGVGLAFVAEAIDTRVRSVDEIGQSLGLPLLARFPERKRRRRVAFLDDGEQPAAVSPALVMLENPAGVDAEGYRILRANLDFANVGRHAQCTMVTSALEAEGKSITAANVALAFARSGRRVALVDLDLRRPSLHRLFGLSGAQGVADVAAGVVELDEALVRVPLDRGLDGDASAGSRRHGDAGSLDVLPAGAVLPDAGELAGTERLREILSDLRERADLVLVDTPGLLQVGDAMALSAHVDALLVVVRFTAIRHPVLKELRRVLDACPARKLGYVVTDVDDDLGYGYGYGYGYDKSDSRERDGDRGRARRPRPVAVTNGRER